MNTTDLDLLSAPHVAAPARSVPRHHPPGPAPAMDFDADDDAPEGSFLRRNWVAMCVATVVLTGGTFFAINLASKGGGGGRKAMDQSFVMIQPLPPPPPAPPPPPPPPEEEEMMKAEEDQPEEVPDNSPAAPSTGITGNGPPDGYGLKNRGAMPRRILGGKKVSLQSKWKPYANAAASRIADAMRRHNKLKSSSMGVEARIWVDSTGRVTRATAQSTGNSAIDEALKNEVLGGMQLSGPPPDGMKMPIVLMVKARPQG